MKITAVFVITLIGGSIAFSQATTVTNSDLEKFRSKRLAAEQDLRDNYAKLGFPSPEELEKQRQQDLNDRLALADKLRKERLERERIEAERQRLALQYVPVTQPVVVVVGQDSGGYLNGYWLVGHRRFPWRSRFPHRGPSIGWRATGGGIIYEPGGSSFVQTGPVVRAPQRPIVRWQTPR